ncbi:UNVERIFIED_CONTAM: hypothetical protein Scaly_0083800 [Sesamum calycinum]|uniref:Uncharacterized protein n=1 Tax=Sesamum calycinum TaxID=2727403 RepID=A0AAW2SUX3_9LAMI
MENKIQEEMVWCLRQYMDIFAWTTKDLDGIDPSVIAHHLNIDPKAKPIKQKRKAFLKKYQIIRAEVDKLLVAGHIGKYSFLSGCQYHLSTKAKGKMQNVCGFSGPHKLCPKDFLPLPRIDESVDSTSGYELQSVMDASQRYHQSAGSLGSENSQFYLLRWYFLLHYHAIWPEKCWDHIPAPRL